MVTNGYGTVGTSGRYVPLTSTDTDEAVGQSASSWSWTQLRTSTTAAIRRSQRPFAHRHRPNGHVAL